MLLTWITDPHYNFLTEKELKLFCEKIIVNKPDVILITGDISEANTLETHLRLMEKYTKGIETYFVCGNHDYYNGSIVETRKMLELNFNKNSRIRWLGNFDYIQLTNKTALVGHDGWYDGKYSDYFESMLDMNDYYCIKELMGNFFCRPTQYKIIGELAEQSANHVSKGLVKAFKTNKEVIIATHVPPFKENSRAPNGNISDKNWLPHFSSKIMGDAILNTMALYPKGYKIKILCGHTHTHWNNIVSKNISCITGHAEYKNPSITGTFVI